MAGARSPAPTARAGYEDWYLLDDFAALGVLNEAAVGRGHRTAHDASPRGASAPAPAGSTAWSRASTAARARRP